MPPKTVLEESGFLSRMPGGRPGQNNINPALAISAKTPLDKLVGTTSSGYVVSSSARGRG